MREEEEDETGGPPGFQAGMQDAWLAANVRDARTLAGMSQGELGRRMKELGWRWSQQTVQRTEDGARKVGAGEAAAVAHLLGTTVDRLLMPGRQASLLALLDMATGRALSAWEEAAGWGAALLAAQRQLEVTVKEAGESEFASDPRVAALLTGARSALELTPESAAADSRKQRAELEEGER